MCVYIVHIAGEIEFIVHREVNNIHGSVGCFAY